MSQLMERGGPERFLTRATPAGRERRLPEIGDGDGTGYVGRLTGTPKERAAVSILSS
jgi:hypothetical protein